MTRYPKEAAERVARARDREGRKLIAQVQDEKLTYLESEALWDLRQRAKNAELQGIPGTIVEAGCALGGSAIVLARSKSPDRDMYVYDVFGMIPPPGDRDGDDVKQRYATIVAGASEGIGGQRYYGYESDLLAKVEANFDRFAVSPSGAQHTFREGALSGDAGSGLARCTRSYRRRLVRIGEGLPRSTVACHVQRGRHCRG